MMTRVAAAFCVFAAVASAAAARAEVVDLRLTGFEVRESVDIAAPPAAVWAALARIGAWWDPEHTFSGVAANLSIDLKPGGCLCESLGALGAGVEHLRIVYVKPPAAARLEGAIGPLQNTGADGHMAWRLEDGHGHTTFTLTYDVGGYAKGGLQTWAKPVDTVLKRQVDRLKRYIETGAP